MKLPRVVLDLGKHQSINQSTEMTDNDLYIHSQSSSGIQPMPRPYKFLSPGVMVQMNLRGLTLSIITIMIKFTSIQFFYSRRHGNQDVMIFIQQF